jgi:hypothetical protein
LLAAPSVTPFLAAMIVHDLLEIRFPDQAWRRRGTRLEDRQRVVLEQIARNDRAWADPPRLWFLLPDGGDPDATAADLRPVRASMLDRLREGGR